MKNQGDQQPRWRDYIADLAWEHFRILQEELENIGGERECLEYRAQPVATTTWPWISRRNGRMDGIIKVSRIRPLAAVNIQ